MPALIDHLDGLTVAMGDGLITRAEAVALLSEWRGLTARGASALLAEWPAAKSLADGLWQALGGGSQP